LLLTLCSLCSVLVQNLELSSSSKPLLEIAQGFVKLFPDFDVLPMGLADDMERNAYFDVVAENMYEIFKQTVDLQRQPQQQLQLSGEGPIVLAAPHSCSSEAGVVGSDWVTSMALEELYQACTPERSPEEDLIALRGTSSSSSSSSSVSRSKGGQGSVVSCLNDEWQKRKQWCRDLVREMYCCQYTVHIWKLEAYRRDLAAETAQLKLLKEQGGWDTGKLGAAAAVAVGAGAGSLEERQEGEGGSAKGTTAAAAGGAGTSTEVTGAAAAVAAATGGAGISTGAATAGRIGEREGLVGCTEPVNGTSMGITFSSSSIDAFQEAADCSVSGRGVSPDSGWLGGMEGARMGRCSSWDDSRGAVEQSIAGGGCGPNCWKRGASHQAEGHNEGSGSAGGRGGSLPATGESQSSGSSNDFSSQSQSSNSGGEVAKGYMRRAAEREERRRWREQVHGKDSFQGSEHQEHQEQQHQQEEGQEEEDLKQHGASGSCFKSKQQQQHQEQSLKDDDTPVVCYVTTQQKESPALKCISADSRTAAHSIRKLKGSSSQDRAAQRHLPDRSSSSSSGHGGDGGGGRSGGSTLVSELAGSLQVDKLPYATVQGSLGGDRPLNSSSASGRQGGTADVRHAGPTTCNSIGSRSSSSSGSNRGLSQETSDLAALGRALVKVGKPLSRLFLEISHCLMKSRACLYALRYEDVDVSDSDDDPKVSGKWCVPLRRSFYNMF
jgi:hypothetical protein